MFFLLFVLFNQMGLLYFLAWLVIQVKGSNLKLLFLPSQGPEFNMSTLFNWLTYICEIRTVFPP